MARAMLDPHRPVPGFVTRQTATRFAVYRNNHVSGLVDVLAETFPVVQALVGEEFFRAMAAAFVQVSPPASPVLAEYGSGFAAFIAFFPPAAPVAPLADMARLEWAMAECLNAADASSRVIGDLQSVPPDELPDLRFVLHPSARLVTSGYPIVSIWRAHQPDGGPVPEDAAREGALVVRPDLTVEIHRLSGAGLGMIEGMIAGRSFGEISGSMGPDDLAHLPVLLRTIMETGVVASFCN
jgi:hypothetical protein